MEHDLGYRLIVVEKMELVGFSMENDEAYLSVAVRQQ
jgi:hypothetical protein